MIGPEGVAAAIADAISDRIVARLELLAGEHGPVDGAEPHVVASSALPVDALPVEEWPVVTVTARRGGSLRRVAVEDGNRVYTLAYTALIVGWVRGDGFETVTRARDRMLLAVRELLLVDPVIADGIVVDENALAEDYAPPGFDEELAATVSAGAIELRVVTTETLTGRPALGRADEFLLEVERSQPDGLWPPHPALS